jgi:hypothetical protein
MERASSLATAAAGVFLALGLVLALVLLSLRAAQDTAPTAQAEATARHHEPAPFALEKTARDAARTPLEPVVEPGAEGPAASLDPGTPFDPRRLLGVVVASDGSPVPGARILLFSREILSWDEMRVPAARAETQSDEDGRFAFGDLEAISRVWLLVIADDFLAQVMQVIVGRHEGIELVRARAFAGRVLDAATRAPLAGVTIELYEYGFDGERLVYPLVAKTDSEGGYSFSSGRLNSPMDLRLSMGSCPAVSRSLRLEAGCADGYDFFVRAPRSIAFTVVDAETGQTFADEEVFIDDAKLHTDWQGRVSVDFLDLPPAGSNLAEQIEASAAGTCITSIDVRVPSEPDGAVVLPLLRSGRIELHVRDAGGSPLPGAHAYCREVKTPPKTPPQFLAGATKERISDKSDQDGILTVDAPPGNSLTLDVGGREGVSARVAVDVPAAGATIAREVILLRGATIEGRVKHGSAPVPRATVICEHAADGHTRRSRAADDGSYRLEHVPPGTVWLRAHVDGSFVSTAARTDELEVEDGEELHHDIEVEVAALTATIEGVVRSSSGRPFAATLVYATSYSKAGHRTQVRRSRATTDAGGRFSLSVADESGVNYFLWVEAGMMHAQASHVSPGARGVELVIPEAAAIALRVVDARTDVPVNDAQIYWRRTGTSDFVGVVDPSSGRDGAIRLELPLGLCDVRARAPHLGYAYGELLAAPVAAQGEPRVWTIALSPGARLDIRFEPWDPAWAGRVDATLLVPREAFAGLDGDDEFWSDEAWEMGRLEPDATGTCRLRELAAGRYSFWEPPEGVRLEPSEIVVPPSALGGAPLEVVVRWSELDDEGRSR